MQMILLCAGQPLHLSQLGDQKLEELFGAMRTLEVQNCLDTREIEANMSQVATLLAFKDKYPDLRLAKKATSIGDDRDNLLKVDPGPCAQTSHEHHNAVCNSF